MSIYACHPSFYIFHLLHNIANGCQIEIKAGNEWFEKNLSSTHKIKSFLRGFEDLINFVSDQIQHIIEKWIKALHTKNMRKNISTFLVNAYKLKQIYMNLIDTSSSWKQEVWQSFSSEAAYNISLIIRMSKMAISWRMFSESKEIYIMKRQVYSVWAD